MFNTVFMHTRNISSHTYLYTFIIEKEILHLATFLNL